MHEGGGSIYCCVEAGGG
ncbi:hypothetical protein VCHC55A1_0311, partial [Vibrio cholerae HC-55A1]